MRKSAKAKRMSSLPLGERVSIPRYLWPLILLLVAGVAAYWNSFDVPFVFDDYLTIQSNSAVHFGDLLTHIPSNLWYRTLLYISFALNYAAGGQNVWGYHLVNLLLHLINGILIYILAASLPSPFGRGQGEGLRIWSTSRPSPGAPLARRPLPEGEVNTFALLASLFFLVHPVQTESVTYISSRSELLSTLFYILAVLLFVRKKPEKIGFGFSLVIAVILALALGAKETTISLPAALLLYDFIFISGGELRRVLSRWRFHGPFLIGGIAAAFYLALFGNLRGSVGTAAAGISPYSYFLTELRVIVRYVQITLFPAGLNLLYDFQPSDSLVEPAVIFSALILAGLVTLAWWLRKRQPIIAFSIFWFFVTLAPTSSFFPINDVIFEHRLYLPMVGLCLSFPLFIQLLSSSVQRTTRLDMAIGSAIIIALITVTVMRNEVWRDETRLWSDVVAKSPYSERGYTSLAVAYYKQKDYDKALQTVKVGMSKVHNNPFKLYYNMGQFYFDLGRFTESADALSQAVKWAVLPADQARSYYNMGVAYLAELNGSNGNDKEKAASQAEAVLAKSIEADPKFLPAWDSYINLSAELGRQEIVREKLNHELTKNPGNALYGLGKLAFQEQNYKDAVGYFQKAEKVLSGEKMLFFNYAYALEEVGDLDEAITKYTAATQIDPLFMQAHYNLAQIYMKKGLDQAAIDHFEQVLQIDPKSAPAHLQLARLFIEHGQAAPARDHLAAILNVSPDNAEAAALWQKVRQN